MVRLGSCLLIELVVGSTLLTGLGLGAYQGGRQLLRATEAHASARVAGPPRNGELGLVPLDKPGRVEAPLGTFGIFHGVRDEYLLAPLRTAAVENVRVNRGGSSLSLRIDFVGGARAAFKPDQVNLQTIPRKEVAAFRINRMLGLAAVPPAIARAFSLEDLLAHLDPRDAGLAPRLRAEIVANADGMATGELSWWIPEIADAKIGGHRIDSVEGIALWKRYLAAGVPMPAEEVHILPQISNMVAFDFLINNMDRWSGNNTKGSPDGQQLYFMDNTLSFGPAPEGHLKVQAHLLRVQKFSRSLVEGLKALDAERLEAAMTRDTGPYDRLLTVDELDAVLARRDYLVRYIHDLIEQHGEEKVLVFP